jgi:GntR family transcriptional regulator
MRRNVSRPPNSPDAIRSLPIELNGNSVKGKQLREHLETMLKSLAPGALLPSERVLADRLQIARGTVRAQLDALVAEGLAKRVPGRGTFVAERFVQTEKMSSFSRDMVARGMTPSSRVLRIKLKESTSLVASKLEIPLGTPVIALERIRYADAEPMALERAFLPAARFAGLEKADVNQRSLYELLATDYGCVVDNAVQRVSVVALRAADARRLGAEVGSPAFDISRVTRDRMVNAVEWGHSLLRGDRYDIIMHVTA